MSEGLTYPFTEEQISSQATLNAKGLMFAAAAFAKEHSLSAEEMWTFVGQRFAPGWEGLLGAPVIEIAKWFALNWISSGSEVRSVSGDGAQAHVVVGGWPSEEDLEFWGLTREETDAIRALPLAITDYLGLEFEWSWDGDDVTAKFARPGGA